ncbi:MAG TPA: response regulator, partial [Thiotrichales bacterium]|nr:response regulator [Thiotrichales bacterium]
LHHEVFHGMVQKLPFIVHSAVNAEQALTLYKQKQPQLLLIDYRLPDSDGLTLAKKLRHLINHHDRQQQTRVVMLTAQSNEHFESALLDGTLDAWLSKPLQLKELILLANDCELNTYKPDISPKSTPIVMRLRSYWPLICYPIIYAICGLNLSTSYITEFVIANTCLMATK